MSTKHTPGPWELRRDDMGGISPLIFPAGQNYPVASVTGYHANDGQRLPNAQLIAAAPELLEAAQAAWNCIGELPPTQARVEVAQLLQAAVEKAIGVQP